MLKKSLTLLFVLLFYFSFSQEVKINNEKFTERYQRKVKRIGFYFAPTLMQQYKPKERSKFVISYEIGSFYEVFLKKNFSFRNELTFNMYYGTNSSNYYSFDYTPAFFYYFHLSNLTISPNIHVKYSYLLFKQNENISSFFSVPNYETYSGINTLLYGFGISAALKYKRFDVGFMTRLNYIILPSRINYGTQAKFLTENKIFIVWKLNTKKK